MKRISLHFSVLLAALFLFAFSCQDHYVPEPTLVRATVQSDAIAGSNPTIITMRILTTGNIPIEEYGIVYSSRFDSELEDINANPTIVDSKLLSAESKMVGPHLVISDFKSSSFADVYYRAYLKHTNGDIVYGEIIYYRR